MKYSATAPVKIIVLGAGGTGGYLIPQLCLQPDKIPLIDTIPAGLYSLPEKETEILHFRGSVFDVEALAEQLKSSDSLDILFESSRLENRTRNPLLPLNLSQIGLVGASGLMNGLVDCEHPHVIKGRIVREKKQKNIPTDREGVTQISEVESNKIIFTALRVTTVIAISAILLLTVTAETAILLSGIWTREKYTLAFLVLAAGIALVYLLFKAFEEKTLKKGYDKASEEISLLERQADELNRSLKISEHNLKTLKETEPEYKRKSEVLESYRNSFPCLVQPGYTLFNVIRTEVVPDKYSRWLIVGEFGDELWKTTIIRRDMQTYGEMLTLISKTETPDGITELNEQNALPWE